MARAMWKGTISFGLVQIPVGLYSAESPDELDFVMLDERNMSRVGYERKNKKTGRAVPWENIVKGYEYRKGKYVVITDDDFKRANPKSTSTIDIEDFVKADDIDPLYFDKPYYLAPSGKSAKGYALLRDALEKTGMAGVAKFVLRTKEHLAALLPRDEALVLLTLRFAHELRDANDLDLPSQSSSKAGATKREVEMAQKLVKDMASKWDPKRYHSRYYDDLRALIKRKATHGDVEDIPTEVERPKHGEVVDMMELLKRSMKSKRGQKTTAQKAPRKARPSSPTKRTPSRKKAANE